MSENKLNVSVVDYLSWKNEYNYILEELHDKKVLFLFSGGKDSSLGMDFISRAAVDYDFGFEVHAGAFPIHRYPEHEKVRIGSYWTSRGIDIIWHDFKENDDQIRNSENPCHACQGIRKKLLNKIISARSDNLHNLFLVVSFSLWDIVGYSLERILGEIFMNSRENKDKALLSKRFIETAQRFYPILKMKDGYTIFRPLIKFNGSHIEEIIRNTGLPTNSIPCEFRGYRPKRVLESYYNKMGLTFDYESVLNFAKSSLGLPDMNSFATIDKDKYFNEFF
jgi:tRNA(Ile)-lysidine synthase TilS/MesJ